MTYQAAIPLGVRVRLLAERADDAAALVAADVALGSPASEAALAAFAAGCDVVTFDHELVDADALERLEAAGRRVRPGAATVRLAQDKRRQRAAFAARGFPLPEHRPVATAADLVRFGDEHGWPAIAKAGRGGYDGRGVWVVPGPAEAATVAQRAAAAGVELLAERRVPIERELAVLVARRPGGEAAVYPVVETVQRDGICHELLVPAPVAQEIAQEAQRLALAVAAAVDAVGVMALELFLAGGRLLVNEIAARPHNSGHYSIDACVTSQFEQHLRAVLDWPLGLPDLVAPAAATVNLLGPADGADPAARLPAALALPGIHVHLYGKTARPGRKLGHVTALDATAEAARRRAREAAALLTGVRAEEAAA
jgi:5-(carboxyamino)imidazole ribonucleotide synthase